MGRKKKVSDTLETSVSGLEILSRKADSQPNRAPQA